MDITLEDVRKIEEEKRCFVDVRDAAAYLHGHIPDAVHFDINADTEQKLPKDKTLIVYCSVGENSKEIVKQLESKGYQAYNLKGGYKTWLLEEYKELEQIELERYERQIILPDVGIEGQKKLGRAKVLIIGAGGLGSPAALYLAAAGVGTIGIVDADVVGISNLHRQIIHAQEHVGMNKSESAKKGIERINDKINVAAYPYDITPENISDIIKDYDFILDGVDNFETKFLINDACVLAQKPFCHAGILRYQGQVMTYVPGDYPCYRCIFEEIPERGSIPNCSQAGIIGAAAGIIGCIQALEAVKFILSSGELLVGKMLVFDGLTMRQHIVNFSKKSPVCRVCGEKRNIFDVSENRMEYERKGC